MFSGIRLKDTASVKVKRFMSDWMGVAMHGNWKRRCEEKSYFISKVDLILTNVHRSFIVSTSHIQILCSYAYVPFHFILCVSSPASFLKLLNNMS